MRQRPTIRRRQEPTIALINIVFLMLVFFMVAGTLSAPVDRDVTLIQTRDLGNRTPPDALVLTQRGDVLYRGAPLVSVDAYLDTLDEDGIARIVPDRDAPAASLVALGQDLSEAGAQRVVIVTERALK